MSEKKEQDEALQGIAVVGMAGRFPGAPVMRYRIAAGPDAAPRPRAASRSG